MTFQRRRLDITIALQKGTFDGKNNTTTLRGYRAHAVAQNAGGVSDGTLDLTVWGMKQTMMDQLSTLGMQITLIPTNGITVAAGNDDENAAIFFAGYIINAYADYKGQPEPAFHITAHTGLPQSVIPATATSYRGSADVATIMASLATQMGLKFENSGVDVKLNNPYFAGSYKTQMRRCAKAAGINASIINGVLCIWPRNGFRNGQIPIISSETGMEGYPSYTANGLILTTIFNPSIGFGQKVQVKSTLKPANGEWVVQGLGHDLASEMIGGRWHSDILGYSPKFPQPVIK